MGRAAPPILTLTRTDERQEADRDGRVTDRIRREAAELAAWVEPRVEILSREDSPCQLSYAAGTGDGQGEQGRSCELPPTTRPGCALELRENVALY